MEMQQNRPNIKYSYALSNFLKLHRWMGIIRFNDFGQIDKKLVLYSVFIVTFQVALLCLSSYLHIASHKFHSLDKVSRVPYTMELISHALHFAVSTTMFLRNNQFLIKMFSCTGCIRKKLSDDDTGLKGVTFKIRLLSFIILVLSIATAVLYAANYAGYGTQLVLALGYLLSFSTYIKEETLIVYAMYLAVMLQIMNTKLRTSVVTAKSVKEFRCIHNELSLLTESVSEHFEPLVTTMVAATGLQTWGNCFALIRITMFESANLHWTLCYVCNATHQLLKLAFICYNCESVKQQELKLKINLHDLSNDIHIPDEVGCQIRCFSLQLALERMEIRGYGFVLNNALLFAVYSTVFSFLLVLLQIHLWY